MRYVATIFLALTAGICSLSGQVLTEGRNLPRTGDVLVREALPFVPPGSSGHDVFWDFSGLSEMEEAASPERMAFLSDTTCTFLTLRPQSSHRYLLRGDSLLCVGYTAPNLSIGYLVPLLKMRYPLAYGDSLSSFHYGEGMYSHKLHTVVYGQSWYKADAEGRMVLTEGDTLSHVLRLHEHARLGERLSPSRSILSLSDSTVLSSDTILMRLASDSVTWTVDTYRWFVAGYRYPVLESVHTSILRDGHAYPHFSRTYYYPPSEQAWLEGDEENEAQRELLAGQGVRNGADEGETGETSPAAYRCETSLSADGGRLDVELQFDGEGYHEVQLQVSTVQGYVIARSPKHRIRESLHESFDLSTAHENVYVLTVFTDGSAQSVNVIKQPEK